MLNGTGDTLIPYAGGRRESLFRRADFLGAEATAQLFATRNGCRGAQHQRVASADARDPTAVVKLAWQDCSSGRLVELYRVEGAGHQIFGRTQFLRHVLGPGSSHVSAADIILDSFARLDRKASAAHQIADTVGGVVCAAGRSADDVCK